jgi:Spaetzle
LFSQPLDPCSYLTENFESSCTQVYNYHRLLSWDNTRGLHVDIFKVPTCCSCHLVGYKEAFPPLGQPSNSILSVSSNRKRPQDLDAFSQSSNRNSQYSTLNGSDDEEGDDDNSNIAYQFGNGFKRLKPRKENQDSNRSTNRRVPMFPETFLSPPANTQDANFPFSNRKSSNRPRTPPLRRKQFDQNVSETDLKISRVSVFPPKTFSQSERPRRITPPISSTIDTNSVNLRLPNAQNSDHKRINYNYHPIIDFFEDGEMDPQRKINDLNRKAGKLVGDLLF